MPNSRHRESYINLSVLRRVLQNQKLYIYFDSKFWQLYDDDDGDDDGYIPVNILSCGYVDKNVWVVVVVVVAIVVAAAAVVVKQ